MSTLEERVKKGFDAIVVPPKLKDETLRLLLKRDESSEHREPLTEPSVVQPAQSKKRLHTRLSRFAAIAACILALAVGIGGFGAYTTETALVAIELNPSLELGINRFNVVISAEAENEDGELVLDSVSVIGKDFSKALEEITSSETFLSFGSDTAFLDISVASNDEQQVTQLMSKSESSIEALPFFGTCRRISSEVWDEARAAGMGIKRFEVASELMNLDSSVALEDCKKMSMRELRQKIAQIDPEHPHAWQRSGSSGHESAGMQENGHARRRGV